MEDHNKQVVQAHVDEKADTHAEHGQLRRAVHLHHDLQTVGEDEADGEQADHVQVLGGVAHRLGTGPQQNGQRFREQGDRHGNHRGDGHDGHHRLGEDFFRFLMVPMPQGEGAQGGGAHGEQDGRTGQDVDKRKGDVDAGQGQLAHALGDKDTVHDGIGREKHHGGHGRNDIV